VKEKTASWLDSSAILALIYGEPGVDIVRQLLEDAERERAVVYLSVLSLCEIVSSLIKTLGESVARDELAVVLTMPVQIESPTRQHCAEAGWLRGRYTLSTADAIIAAQAIAANAELVHKDPEFDQVPGLRHRRLPYKTKSARRR
jgi:predicted nucleic acid-binding protein